MKSRALKVFMHCNATACKVQDPKSESYILTFTDLEKHQMLFDFSRQRDTNINQGILSKICILIIHFKFSDK